MSLKATYQYLAKTENEAAVDILIAALDCGDPQARHHALRALLERNTPTGHAEVFRRLPSMDAESRAAIEERPDRLARAVGEALQDPDPRMCAKACDAIVSLRLYDVLPGLVSALVDTENPHHALAALTALKLSELFYGELSGAEEPARRRDVDTLRQRLTTSLEEAVRKYHRHKQPEAVEALLLLAKLQNATLRHLLSRPDEASHRTIVQILENSSRGGVVRLLLGFLEDPQAPRAVIGVLSRRSDAKFVEHMLKSVGPKPSKAVVETLQRIESLAWAKPGHPVFAELSDAAQEAAVQVLTCCGLDSRKVLDALGHLLLEGKPAGRRAAAKALPRFQEPEAAALTVKGLNDADPEVRAALVVQLRPRNIPGALSLLIRMVDTPHAEVQEALRAAMPEFTLKQYLANFDDLPEELRAGAGHLVKKIDAECRAKLEAEMAGLSPVRRRRAVAAANAMGLVGEVEQTVIKLLSDEDHTVRVVVAKALADCKSAPTWEALRDAMLDRSVIVQEAVVQSLELISRSLLPAVQEEQPQAEEVAP